MGQMFKVLAISEPNLTALAGFNDDGEHSGQDSGQDTGTDIP
jgi:hypothetical protein